MAESLYDLGIRGVIFGVYGIGMRALEYPTDWIFSRFYFLQFMVICFNRLSFYLSLVLEGMCTGA